MSFRTDILAAIDGFRAISGPTGYDIRTNQLTIRTRVWSGDYAGDGVYEATDLVLPAIYPIRQVTGQDIEGSGGKYTTDDLIVSHITPSNGAGVGYTKDQLKPPVTDNRTDVVYLISGPEGGEFALIDGRFHKPFSYSLVLRRVLQ